jgi:Protein of unknown function (DUF2934)
MEREQAVRELAYALWVADGCPHGRAVEHWRQAEAQIDADMAQANNPDRGSALGKPARGARDGGLQRKLGQGRTGKPQKA